MDEASSENWLDAIGELTPEQRLRLYHLLKKKGAAPAKEAQKTLEAVEKTKGTMKGLDRETIIWLAEDEDLCGY
jgi:hypothetical protein